MIYICIYDLIYQTYTYNLDVIHLQISCENNNPKEQLYIEPSLKFICFSSDYTALKVENKANTPHLKAFSAGWLSLLAIVFILFFLIETLGGEFEVFRKSLCSPLRLLLRINNKRVKWSSSKCCSIQKMTKQNTLSPLAPYCCRAGIFKVKSTFFID